MNNRVRLLSSAFRHLIIIIILAISISCGGGGGGDSSATTPTPTPAPPPTPGPGDTENYFPFIVGNEWNYRSSTASSTTISSETYASKITVTGLKSILGVTTTVISFSNTLNPGQAEEQYYLKNDDGVMFYGNNDPADVLTPQFIPYKAYEFPMKEGSSFVSVNKTKLNFGSDLDGDGINEKVDVYSVISVKGFESVTVFIGTFNNCAKVESNVSYTVTGSAYGEKANVTSIQTDWMAPGIGPVKRVVETRVEGQTYETTTSELTGYSLNGQTKGIIHESTLAINVSPPDSDSEHPGKPAIGSDGSNYLVVHRKKTDPMSSAESMNGIIIKNSGEVITNFQWSDRGGNRPAVAFDGTNYLAVYGTSINTSEIIGQRISKNGVPLDGSRGFAISTGDSNSFPKVAYDGTNYMVVWSKYLGTAGNEREIYFSIVTPNGTVLNELPINAPEQQLYPAIAFDGTNYFVIWSDTRGGNTIYGTRITPAGNILDPGGVPVCTVPASAGYIEPQIIFDGTNYFAVWSNGYDIYGKRINKNGFLIDGPASSVGIAINFSTASRYPQVMFDGNNYLVTWSNGDYSDTSSTSIYGARVSRSGTVLDGNSGFGLQLSGNPPPNTYYAYPAIFSNGTNSLLTWVKQTGYANSTKDLRGLIMYPF